MDDAPQVDLSEVRSAYRALKKVFDSGILERPGEPLFEAAITVVLINLNDLLQKAAKAGRRVSFTDDVRVVVGAGPSDVSTLINDARNAACHLTSSVQKLGFGRIRFNVYKGLCPNAIRIGDDVFGCDYADDTAVQYGPIRVYLRRHVQRCVDELQKVFPPA